MDYSDYVYTEEIPDEVIEEQIAMMKTAKEMAYWDMVHESSDWSKEEVDAANTIDDTMWELELAEMNNAQPDEETIIDMSFV